MNPRVLSFVLLGELFFSVDEHLFAECLYVAGVFELFTRVVAGLVSEAFDLGQLLSGRREEDDLVFVVDPRSQDLGS